MQPGHISKHALRSMQGILAQPLRFSALRLLRKYHHRGEKIGNFHSRSRCRPASSAFSARGVCAATLITMCCADTMSGRTMVILWRRCFHLETTSHLPR